MHVFKIKIGLESGINQDQIIQLIKNNGGDTIQTSDGLCVKSNQNKSELEKAFVEKDMSGLRLQPLDPEKDDLTPDIKNFIGLH